MANKNKSEYKRNPYLCIYGVSNSIHEDLHNIADNLGIPLSQFLKPELRKIADSYSADMKKPIKKD